MSSITEKMKAGFVTVFGLCIVIAKIVLGKFSKLRILCYLFIISLLIYQTLVLVYNITLHICTYIQLYNYKIHQAILYRIIRGYTQVLILSW